MKRLLILAQLVSLHAYAQLGPEAAAKVKPALPYPAAERRDLVEEMFGVKVSDPYRWLEDGKDEKVRGWATAEDKLTRAQLKSAPGREALEKRIKELLYVEELSTPVRRGQRLFFSRTAANAEKAIFYVRGPGGNERVVLDPLKLAPDGTLTIGTMKPSWDGSKFLYTRNQNNADEAVLYIRNATTGEDFPEHIEGVNYGIVSWNPNGEGFWYQRFPTNVPAAERVAHAEMRYHKLGTDPAKDKLEHAPSGSNEKFPSQDASRDGHWLFYYLERGSHENDVWVRDLRQPSSTFQPLILGLPAYSGVLPYHDHFYVHTNQQAPRGKVMLFEPGEPFAKAKTVIAEDPKALLEDVQILGGKLVLKYLRNASSEVEIRELDGKLLRKLTLPAIGTVDGVTGDESSDEIFFGFTSFTTPYQVFRDSVASDKREKWAEVKVPVDVSPFTSEQVWYPSKDGTQISMFIVRRKDLKKDASTPFLIDGYGGFAVNQTPYFSVGSFLLSGGALAYPNLRGGGEYGEEWHKAGIREKKQNVFDDMIAAAEYLVKERYTKPSKLAIMGGSNGGLLMSALITQRPELFGAVVCMVPLTDMIRYPRFGIAKLWVSEFGSPEAAGDFKVLAAYSPYHHVKPAKYPAALFMSSDSDDRVDPLHARKMVAALQAANLAKTPILLRVESHAGHGGADARAAWVEESADRNLFLFQQLGFAKRADAPWLR
jgi:prolyl oligopeptidase